MSGSWAKRSIREQVVRADYRPTLQHVRSKLRPVDYEEIPRGRVLFMKATGRFCVDMDKALHNPKFKATVIREFALPKSSENPCKIGVLAGFHAADAVFSGVRGDFRPVCGCFPAV